MRPLAVARVRIVRTGLSQNLKQPNAKLVPEGFMKRLNLVAATVLSEGTALALPIILYHAHPGSMQIISAVFRVKTAPRDSTSRDYVIPDAIVVRQVCSAASVELRLIIQHACTVCPDSTTKFKGKQPARAVHRVISFTGHQEKPGGVCDA